VVTIELAGIGTIRRGLTGDVAWEVSPMTGARIITGDERTQFLREATFNAELIWKELYPKAELAGMVQFAGQPAYKVTLTATDGDTQTRYFAKDTLLPLGLEQVAKSQMGNIPGESTLSDWRDVGGIKFPHKVAQKQGPQTFEILIDKIELDPALDPSTFAVPPEIAALQKPATPAKP
jgi:zinc protease